MRTMTQPGPVQQPRILSAVSAAVRDLMVELPESADLLDGLRDAVLAAGGRSAGIALLGGTIARLRYFTGMPNPSGHRLATYGDPTPLAGPITLLSGNAILGRDVDGGPIMHGHAVFTGPGGRVHGGHLPPGGCPVGAGGVRALAVLYDGAVLRSTVSTPAQQVFGGVFVKGENPICITLDLVLQEWVPAPESSGTD